MARIFVLTGAGVSAESGLGTFRDTGGIWAKFDPMKLATPEAFAADPVSVHGFYNARRRNLLAAAPNAAHFALAQLAGEGLFLCTQNIDDLHERGGSPQTHHMHGELLRALCARCGATHAWRGDMSVLDACPICGQAGALRPDVVWFGETPYGLDRIEGELEEAEIFVAIGTSGAVYPAAGYVETARRLGLRRVEINLEPSDTARAFDERRYGPASVETPRFVAELLGHPRAK